jgi:hypothetical protein
VIFTPKDRFGQFQPGELAAKSPFDTRPPRQIPQRRNRCAFFQAFGVAILLNPLVQQIRNPGPDRFDKHLSAFFVKKAEHIEIAVTLRRLRPEYRP